jgi:hypothetical protein
MPVNETVDFRDALREQMGMELDTVVVNAIYPERFSHSEAERIERAADSNGSPGVRAALKAALFEHRRAGTQRGQLRRLRRQLGRGVITLPFLFEPELGLDSFERLSAELEPEL